MQNNDSIVHIWDSVFKDHDWYNSTSVTQVIVSNNNDTFYHGNVVNYTLVGLLLYNIIMASMLCSFNNKKTTKRKHKKHGNNKNNKTD